MDRLSWIFFFLCVSGFLIETIADQQKWNFRLQFRDKFITTGLWKYSQHPNYFGDIIMFIGHYLIAFAILKEEEHIAILSPIVVTLLIFFCKWNSNVRQDCREKVEGKCTMGRIQEKN